MLTITRRTAIQAMAAPAFLRAASSRATAFALVGDRYHNSDYMRTGLGKTLVRDAGISIDFSDEVKLLNAETLAGYKLLIVFRDGMLWPDGYSDEGSNAAWANRRGDTKLISEPPVPAHPSEPMYWIQPHQGKAVKEFVSNGGGVLFYHNVTYISPHNDDFRDVLGAVTQNHPPIRKFKVKVVNPDHPITRGVSDFTVTDEQHYMTYQKDPKYLLLQSVNEDGLTFTNQGTNLGTTAAAGWAYDYGKGRVCYLAPGHMLTDLWNPEYEKLQKNAVKWLLRQS
jgi:type 1 glutamine amidotransferase